VRVLLKGLGEAVDGDDEEDEGDADEVDGPARVEAEFEVGGEDR
jgi:hypothetical protein